MSTMQAVCWFGQGLVDLVLLWGLGTWGGKIEELRWRMHRLEAPNEGPRR